MSLRFLDAILGIPLTEISVNPARSLGPAVFAGIYDGGFALSQVWVFLVSPCIGAVLAACVYKGICKEKKA